MSIYLMICYAILIAYVGSLLGLIIKLLEYKANLSILIITPFIPILAFILIIVHSSKKPYMKNKVKWFFDFLWFAIRTIPFISGIICAVLAATHVSVESTVSTIVTKGIVYFYKSIRKELGDIGKSIFNDKSNGLKRILN